eukprot:Nitzschia sp. Nitz4//scaffold56_size114212//12758//13574//NITZ4_003932-RA/size114212-snap-gene-0.176-mRNA-1//-1//CDS//3329554652//6170//frame0
MIRGTILSLLALLSASSALELLITGVSCEDKPIAAKFSYICNGDFLCSLGESETMEGNLIYNGFEETYGVEYDDYLLIDTNMYVSLAGYAYEYSLSDMEPIPVCSDYFTATDDNYGDCPADGNYTFTTNYMLPSPDSEYLTWAATGWTGQIVIDMFLSSSELVGKCTLEFQTMTDGSYEGTAFTSMPSGKTAAITIVAVVAAILSCFLYCCCCRRGASRKSTTEPETNYRSMDTGGTVL